jgi:hypothetical protein
VPAEWAQWLRDRAEAADSRREELGAQLAERADQLPEWAQRSLGPVPDDTSGRQDWERRAGIAAAYRELAGHADETDPLGRAPGAGLPEKQAFFNAAHDALDLIDAGKEEANLTDGQLRTRSAALTREEIWAPQYVADQLATTRQQADTARADATIWEARAERSADPHEASQLRVAAEHSAREAHELDQRAQSLETADEIRATWFAHTAVTRDHAERARAELRNRGIDPADTDDRVTAQQWWDAHLADQAKADLHREISSEYDLTDHHTLELEATREPELLDIRETSTSHPSERTDAETSYRVPSVDDTAEIVSRAQAALAEIADRTRTENQETERIIELGQWNHDTRGVEVAAEQHNDLAYEL